MGEGLEQKFVNDVIKSTGMTFEAFKKNPEKFRARTDDWFVAADEGNLIVNHAKNKYYAQLPSGNSYSCPTLGHVERVFAAEGYRKEHLYFKSEMRQGATTDYFCKVTWEVKPECLK